MNDQSQGAARDFLIQRLLAQASREGKPLSPSDVARLAEPARPDAPVTAEGIAADSEVLERVEPLLTRAYLADRRRSRSEGRLYERQLATLQDDDALIAVAARTAMSDFLTSTPLFSRWYTGALLFLLVLLIVAFLIAYNR
jgi:hypothetical protein